MDSPPEMIHHLTSFWGAKGSSDLEIPTMSIGMALSTLRLWSLGKEVLVQLHQSAGFLTSDASKQIRYVSWIISKNDGTPQAKPLKTAWSYYEPRDVCSEFWDISIKFQWQVVTSPLMASRYRKKQQNIWLKRPLSCLNSLYVHDKNKQHTNTHELVIPKLKKKLAKHIPTSESLRVSRNPGLRLPHTLHEGTVLESPQRHKKTKGILFGTSSKQLTGFVEKEGHVMSWNCYPLVNYHSNGIPPCSIGNTSWKMAYFPLLCSFTGV